MGRRKTVGTPKILLSGQNPQIPKLTSPKLFSLPALDAGQIPKSLSLSSLSLYLSALDHHQSATTPSTPTSSKHHTTTTVSANLDVSHHTGTTVESFRHHHRRLLTRPPPLLPISKQESPRYVDFRFRLQHQQVRFQTFNFDFIYSITDLQVSISSSGFQVSIFISDFESHFDFRLRFQCY